MKEQMRKKVLGLRDALNEEERRQKSTMIAKNLAELPEFKAAERVMLFSSFGSEVETKELATLALALGKRVFLPIVEPDGSLLAGEINENSEFTSGPFGIREPSRKGLISMSPDELDLVVVPGVAFDRRGFRIGYGGGYYDRFLKGLRRDAVSVGVSFDVQIVDRIPVEEHDQAVGLVVTENRVIDCRNP